MPPEIPPLHRGHLGPTTPLDPAISQLQVDVLSTQFIRESYELPMSSRLQEKMQRMNSEKTAAPQDPESARVSPSTTLSGDVSPELAKVFERHSRIDLIPMPSDDPADPYNWASWKKHLLLFQVAFHAMMGPFVAAAVIPAFPTFAEDFNISITQASYFTTVPIIFLGAAPLFWAPVADRIGRRPIYLISTLGTAACVFGSAYCRGYGSLMAARALTGIMIAPPQAIGASTVAELFFRHERAQKMGIWTLLVTLGPPSSPLIFGFVVQNKSWHWIFWVLSIVLIAEFVLYLFIGPETLFDRPYREGFDKPIRKALYFTYPMPPPGTRVPPWKQFLVFRRWDRTPWSRYPLQVIKPFEMFTRLPVLLPTIAYTILFAYTSVLLTVEIPALLGIKYNLDASQTGLQFIAAILGGVLGEPLAGFGSDAYMAWKQRQGRREPEMRLWIALPGFVFGVVGLIVFGVQLQNTEAAGRWNITPDVGTAIAFFGLQLVTTVSITYAVESQGEALAQNVVLFITCVRQTYGFTAPFYFNKQFDNMGPGRAAGLLAALSGAGGFLTLATMIYGQRWREARLAKAAVAPS